MSKSVERRRYFTQKQNLEDLKAAQGTLEAELDALKERRNAALTALVAKSDKSQRQVIDDLEAAEKETRLNLEAHSLLVKEAEKEAVVEEVHRKAREEERRAELEVEFAEQERQECDALCAGFEDRKRDIITKWLTFSKAYAELQIVNARLQSHPATKGKADLLDLAFRLRVHLTDAPRLNGLRPLFNTGHKGSLTAWPCIDPTGLDVPPGVPGSPLNVVDVAQAMKTKRWADFQQNYQGEKK